MYIDIEDKLEYSTKLEGYTIKICTTPDYVTIEEWLDDGKISHESNGFNSVLITRHNKTPIYYSWSPEEIRAVCGNISDEAVMKAFKDSADRIVGWYKDDWHHVVLTVSLIYDNEEVEKLSCGLIDSDNISLINAYASEFATMLLEKEAEYIRTAGGRQCEMSY